MRLSFLFLKKLVLSGRSGALIRRITILSFFAIVLSITAFFVVLFVMNGMNKNIKNRILTIEPHLTTINSPEQEPDIKKSIEKAQAVRYQSLDLILRTIDGQFRGGEAVGYTAEGLEIWMQHLMQTKKGNQEHNYIDANLSNISLGENEIAIGVDLARSLSLLEGDELTLIPPDTLLLSSLETPIFQKVTVKRIINTDLYDLDSKLIIFNSEKSLKIFSKTLSRRTGTHIWFDSVDKAEPTKKFLAGKNIISETWQEKNSDLFFALKMEKLMIGTFLGLAGLIASSSILTVLALLMSQKKRDIAIIKTLGLSQKRTLWLFTQIGLLISGGAILLGSFLGVGASIYIQYNPINVLPNIYYDSSIPAFVDFNMVIVVVGISALLALFGSYFPARATLKIQPAILLKQKN